MGIFRRKRTAIHEIQLTVKPCLVVFAKYKPNYSQTLIAYQYFTKQGKANFESGTGIIENKGNVWLHPPIDKYFRIIE